MLVELNKGNHKKVVTIVSMAQLRRIQAILGKENVQIIDVRKEEITNLGNV